MITLNNTHFAANDAEFSISQTTEKACAGFYRAYKNVINLMDAERNKIGVITKHKVLALATRLDDGRFYYSYGDIPLIGEYASHGQKCDDVREALALCNVK